MKERKMVILRIFILLVCVVAWTGCNNNLLVLHDPLQTASVQREGTLLVKPFKFSDYVEMKVNLAPGVDARHELTKYFAEALERVGYKTYIADSPALPPNFQYDAVLEGKIQKINLGGNFMTWCNVDVDLLAFDPSGNTQLWEAKLHGNETNVLWWGTRGEFQKVFRQAVTHTLNQAIEKFASEQFLYTVVKRQEAPAVATQNISQ